MLNYKIQFLLFTILFHSFSSNLMNFDETCTLFKNSLYSIVEEIRDLTPINKEMLNQTSFRGFTKELLKTVKFDHINEENKQISLIYSEKNLNILNIFFDSNFDQLETEKNEAKNKLEISQKNFNQSFESFKLEINALDSHKNNLLNAKNKISDDILKKIDFVNKCNNFTKQLEIYNEPTIYLLTVIESIMNEPEINSEDIAVEYNKLKLNANDISNTSKILTEYSNMTFEIMNSVLEISQYSEEKAAKKKLDKALADLKKLGTASITKIKKSIDTQQKKILKEINKDKDYLAFKDLNIKTAKIVSSLQKKKILYEENLEILKQTTKQYNLSKWKKPRFYVNKIDKFKNKIAGLDFFINSNNNISETINDVNLKKQLKNFENELNKKKQLLINVKAVFLQTESLLNKSSENEKFIDKLLAFTLIHLQNNPSNKKCFKKEELSTLLYYMNLSQIIYNPKNFIEAYINPNGLFDTELANIDNSAYKKSKKTMINFISKYNPKTFIEFSGNYKENDHEQTENLIVKLSSLMLTENHETLGEFKKNVVEEKRNSFYRGLMKVVGFTKEAILFAGTYTVVSLLIKKLLIVIFGGISFGLGYGIAIYLAVGLVKFLLHELIHWLSHQNIITMDKVKILFNDIFGSLISKFNKNVVSLDFETTINQSLEQEYETLKSKSKILNKSSLENKKIMTDELNLLIEKNKILELIHHENTNSSDIVII